MGKPVHFSMRQTSPRGAASFHMPADLQEDYARIAKNLAQPLRVFRRSGLPGEIADATTVVKSAQAVENFGLKEKCYSTMDGLGRLRRQYASSSVRSITNAARIPTTIAQNADVIPAMEKGVAATANAINAAKRRLPPKAFWRPAMQTAQQDRPVRIHMSAAARP
jgi:hypothetical protein